MWCFDSWFKLIVLLLFLMVVLVVMGVLMVWTLMMLLQLVRMQTPAVMGMMLVNRKTSYKDGMPLADYGPDENLNDNADIEWVNKNWVSMVCHIYMENNIIFSPILYLQLQKQNLQRINQSRVRFGVWCCFFPAYA